MSVKTSVASSTKNIISIDKALIAQVQEAAEMVAEHVREAGKVILAGNGGSATDAQHVATEFMVRLRRDRGPIPAIALNTDTAIITAHANDYDYTTLFSRQAEALMCMNDIVIVFTTSGNSPNIKKLLELCWESKVTHIVFTGPNEDSDVSRMCTDDTCTVIHCPGRDTGEIQEVHRVLYHALCTEVENILHPSP